MSIFSRLFSKNNGGTPYSVRLERAMAMHGQVIKYVTERKNDNEDVVGRGGALTVKDDTFIVDSSGDRLFVCKISELETSMLMSGDGVIVRGPNLLENGKYRCITVHFVYYRK